MHRPAAALLLALTTLTHADTIAFNNLGPSDSYNVGSYYIINGPQSQFPVVHAFQFTSQATGNITRLTLPLVHNSGPNLYRFEIYSESAGSPGASLGIIGSSPGFIAPEPPLPHPPPVQITAPGSIHLVSGTKYWVVGFADAATEGGWHANIANTIGHRAYHRYDAFWRISDVEHAAFRLDVAPDPCYANCDHSSVTPILNANDFQCFLNSFAAGNSSANCDLSTTPPILNANDFQCFLNKFATGCP